MVSVADTSAVQPVSPVFLVGGVLVSFHAWVGVWGGGGVGWGGGGEWGGGGGGGWGGGGKGNLLMPGRGGSLRVAITILTLARKKEV